MYLFSNISPTLVSSTLPISLTFTSTLCSSLFILRKRKCKRFKKYLILGNLFTLSNLCFVVGHFYYNNINMKLSLYNLLKQKAILRLLKKRYFKLST